MTESTYIKNLVMKLKDKFNLSDYETEFLERLNTELRRPVPTTQLGIEDRLYLLDVLKIDLHNMLYVLEERFSSMEYEYKEKYNIEHTRLVRAGRPSEAAIDSEIHTNTSLKSTRDLLNDWQSFKGLLTSYLSVIKACKDTCLKKFV